MRTNLKSRGNDEEGDDFFVPSKDWLVGVRKLIPVLVIFMTGLVIGLATSPNFSRHYNSHTEIFFPSDMYSSISDYSGFKNFIKPALLIHRMTDSELFWRASLVPKMEDYPFPRVPKVAFLFLTRGPLPFMPLWDLFFKGHEGLYSVYVHAFPDYKLNAARNSSFYGRQIPSEEASWGSITLVDAEKRMLANALLDFSNEHFVLLSESCIPLFNFTTVYEYLINSIHSYVESYNINIPDCSGRYNRRMAPDIQRDQWRKGSEWFVLSRKLAINIIADYKYYSIFRKFCRPSCYSDEHYIPTFLHMFSGALNANRTLTWLDWSRGGSHPALHGAVDITKEFIQGIRTNTTCMYNDQPTSIYYLFARKFAPSALGPLLNLTTTLLGF